MVIAAWIRKAGSSRSAELKNRTQALIPRLVPAMNADSACFRDCTSERFVSADIAVFVPRTRVRDVRDRDYTREPVYRCSDNTWD